MLIFTYPGGMCEDTIQRIWTVTDHCLNQQDPNSGIFEFEQILIFSDTSPVIIVTSGTYKY
ncbi:MAG: hypothetical protein R2771_07405 [Saprospiraceae bacterium]